MISTRWLTNKEMRANMKGERRLKWAGDIVSVGETEQEVRANMKGGHSPIVKKKIDNKPEVSAEDVLCGVIVEISLCLADAIDSLAVLETQKKGGDLVGKTIVKAAPKKSAAKAKGKIKKK